MKAITEVEARKWCSQKSLGLRVVRFDFLSYKQSKHVFFITAPEKQRMITALSYHILNCRGEHSFSGGLLWLQRWDIGSPEMVRELRAEFQQWNPTDKDPMVEKMISIEKERKL